MRATISLAALAAGLSFAGPALAKPAKCFTTDDGAYPCNFRALDKAGSFEISAPGKPTFTLEVDEPGLAHVFADFGTGRSVALPGQFARSRQDGACWENGETQVKLCAW